MADVAAGTIPRVTESRFVSYAQNGEDVLLWRALGHVTNGRYVDVGAWSPVEHSVTKAFYLRGWRGIDVEPTPEMAALLRADRPEDEVYEVAVTSSDAETVRFHQFLDTGLSTLRDDIAATHRDDGWEMKDLVVSARPLAAILQDSRFAGDEVHFLKVDVEGAERDVLESVDLRTFRPWVVLVEATEPLSTSTTHELWEDLLVDAGYEFCIFDGLSRFYVAKEHAELKPALSYPVCVFDEFDSVMELDERRRMVAAESEGLWRDVVHWRRIALEHWAGGFAERDAKIQALTTRQKNLETRQKRLLARMAARRSEVAELRDRLARVEGSRSWRLTEPLRRVRSRGRSDSTGSESE